MQILYKSKNSFSILLISILQSISFTLLIYLNNIGFKNLMSSSILKIGNLEHRIIPAKKDSISILTLKDLNNDLRLTTGLPHRKKRIAAYIAWWLARHSRSSENAVEISKEMGMKGVNPDQKLEQTFVNYGHASVGDMARLPVHIDNVPMHLPLALFNLGVINSGQEKSNRYQDFKKSKLHSGENYMPSKLKNIWNYLFEHDYQAIGSMEMKSFNAHVNEVREAFTQFFKPETKKQKASLETRVLDSARCNLLLGNQTGMGFETSAREWSRIIGLLKASPMKPFYLDFAETLQNFLCPIEELESKLDFAAQAPSLIRHANAQNLTNENLEALKKYIKVNRIFSDRFPGNDNGLETSYSNQSINFLSRNISTGERVLLQYLKIISPASSTKNILEWIRERSNEEQKKLSEIIFKGHGKHNEMPLGRVTNDTLESKMSLGEMRDLNRHKAYGRFLPLPLLFGDTSFNSIDSILNNQNYGIPLYLKEKPFKKLGEKMKETLEKHYKQVSIFFTSVVSEFRGDTDYGVILNLLPLAHQLDFFMHGDPSQDTYMTNLRVAPGGHINYRDLAYGANYLIADSDPLLEGLRISEELKPDPLNREQFFDRS